MVDSEVKSPPVRYQRESDAFEAYIRREKIPFDHPHCVVARRAWRAALQWKEGRTHMESAGALERGKRVAIVEGEHSHTEGVVEFVEPSGRVWVLRDTASTATFYYPSELSLIPVAPPPARRQGESCDR